MVGTKWSFFLGISACQGKKNRVRRPLPKLVRGCEELHGLLCEGGWKAKYFSKSVDSARRFAWYSESG